MENWFKTNLKKVMKHNQFEDNQITVEECDKVGSWTPCDLIIREELNNGGCSAKGFLGIMPRTCHKCYDYIKEHKQEFIDANMINKKGVNNWGFVLWNNYEI